MLFICYLYYSNRESLRGSDVKTTALSNNVDKFGDVALRALDLTFFVAEKMIAETPKVVEEAEKVSYKIEEGLKDGDGEVGWKQVRQKRLCLHLHLILTHTTEAEKSSTG